MDSIWGNIFRDRKKQTDPVAALLVDVPLFEGLTSRELARVKEFLHRREYAAGEVVFNQGVSGFGMYIVESGSVRILDENSGNVLAELGAGEFFGELALLSKTPRSAAAIASVPTKLLGFFHSDLTSLIGHDPKMGAKIAMKLAEVLGERLINTNQRLCMTICPDTAEAENADG